MASLSHGPQKRQKPNDYHAVTSTNIASRRTWFPFMELPQELRRKVYKYCDLTTTSSFNAAVLKNYVKGKPTSICSLVDTSASIRAEAFEIVLHQNEIDLIGLKQVFHLIKTYIGKTQIRDFDFWHHIHNVNILVKTRTTITSAKTYLQECKSLRRLTMLPGRATYKDYIVRKHCFEANLWRIIDGIKTLEYVNIGGSKWKTIPMSELAPGTKSMERFVDWDPNKSNWHIGVLCHSERLPSGSNG